MCVRVIASSRGDLPREIKFHQGDPLDAIQRVCLAEGNAQLLLSECLVLSHCKSLFVGGFRGTNGLNGDTPGCYRPLHVMPLETMPRKGKVLTD